MKDIDGLPNDAPDALVAIEKADIAVAEAAGEVVGHPAVKFLGEASEMADQPPLVAASLVTIAAGLVLRRPAIAAAGLRMLAAHATATGIKAIVKRSVDRTRPHVLVDEGRYELAQGERNEPRYNSFPSGHTAGAVAVAEAIARTLPRAAWPARAWAVAIAALQIPRCAHYPSDVGAGAAIGWAGDRLVRLAERGARAMLRR